MVRLCYILASGALLAACGVFGLCVRQWCKGDLSCDSLLGIPEFRGHNTHFGFREVRAQWRGHETDFLGVVDVGGQGG
jgi:hypothetical protein